MADVNDILSNNEVPGELLISYLTGKLHGEEREQIEKQLKDDAFVKDALEGLQQFSSNKKLDQYVRTLNQNLHKQLIAKKQKRWQRRLTNPSWIMMATIIILLLCVLAYVVVTFAEKH